MEVLTDPFGLADLGVDERSMPDRVLIRHLTAPMASRGGELPHAGCSSLWELPTAITRTDRYWLRGSVGAPARPITRLIELPYPGDGPRSLRSAVVFDLTQSRSQQIRNMIVDFSELMHQLVERAASHEAVVDHGAACWYPFRFFLHELNDRKQRNEREPPVSTITIVRDRLEQPLAAIMSALRRVLVRRRKLTPVALAQSVDGACIQWLSRQPGRTLRQQAGPKQEVLAVVREDSVDTFENRVLKACLQLCSFEAARYLDEHEAHFGAHVRVKNIRRFQIFVDECLRSDELMHVSGLVDDARPNYVLQFEPRYQAVWWAYQELLWLTRRSHSLWQWRHRIWSEFVLFDMLLAFSRVSSGSGLDGEAEVGVLRDPQRGLWLHHATRFPTFIIVRNGATLAVEICAPMQGARPRESFGATTPCDVLISVRDASDRRLLLEVPIICLASFLPELGSSDGSSDLIFVQPEDQSPVANSRDDEPGGNPALRISYIWPLWGERRSAAADQLASVVLDRGLAAL